MQCVNNVINIDSFIVIHIDEPVYPLQLVVDQVERQIHGAQFELTPLDGLVVVDVDVAEQGAHRAACSVLVLLPADELLDIVLVQLSLAGHVHVLEYAPSLKHPDFILVPFANKYVYDPA